MNASHTLRLRYLAAATAALALAACGGGGSSDSAAPTPAPAPSPSPAPAPAPVPTVSATCDQLTSGTYRLISPADAEASTVSVTMDASGTPQLAYADGTADSLQAGAEACSFTSAKNADSLVVGKGGVVVVAAKDGDGTRYPALLFPEQEANAADLTGTWNRIAWQRAGDGGIGQPFALEYGTISFAAGSITGAKFCETAATAGVPIGCTDAAPQAGFAASASGGFTGSGGLAGTRGFVFKNGSDTLQVWLDQDGSVSLLTKQAALGNPTVGATSSSWNVQATTSGAVFAAATDTLPGVSTSTNTTTTVDTAAGTITRDSSNAGAAAVSQTLYNNAPLPGMRVRQGVSGSVSPAVMVPLTPGLTAVGRLNATVATTPGTGNGFFVLSVGKP